VKMQSTASTEFSGSGSQSGAAGGPNATGAT